MTIKTLASALALLGLFLPAPAMGGRDASLSMQPYVHAYEPRSVDERGMWMEADEFERTLLGSSLMVRDQALNNYVREVLCETVGADRCGAVRIYILDMPAFNATMMPNGVLQVWTGLLLRVRSAAELGAVLGHEFAHFELRHGLKGFENKRTTKDILAWISVVGVLVQSDVTDFRRALIGAMYRYSRKQEEEADKLGLAYLGQSRLPSTSAARVWRNLMAEADATAYGRKQKVKHKYNAGFFDSHPTELKRADYLSKGAEPLGDAHEDPQSARHYAAIQDILPKLLDDQVKLGDFGGTEYLLDKISGIMGWTAPLIYARAEMYRTRGNPRDMVTAAEFYREAIAQGYEGTEAHRNLGLTLLRGGNSSEAAGHLSEYLRLTPDAPDAAVINSLIAAPSSP